LVMAMTPPAMMNPKVITCTQNHIGVIFTAQAQLPAAHQPTARPHL
jgi:hypothetical protein